MMPERIAFELAQPESELQRNLTDFCRRRIAQSARRWQERHDAWRENEQLYRAFRTPDTQDKQTRGASLTQGVEKIVVPYGFAVLQSMLAFFMTVFTQRVPMVPVAGMGPGDVQAAILHELILEYQCDRMQPTGVLLLFQQLFDSLRYGIGVVKGGWTIREWPDLVRVVKPTPDGLGFTDSVQRRNVVAYEGNEWQNVSPFDFLPDPNLPFGRFQEGEFCAHRLRSSFTRCQQRQAEGLYVGIDHIPKHTAGGPLGASETTHGALQSDLSRITNMSELDIWPTDEQGHPFVELHELYTFLDNPAALGLPTDDDEVTPGLWVFTLANQGRTIRAEPANLPGRRFPFEIIEINYDLHSPANVGMIEVFRGLQYHLSWLFNARMQAVRKTLTNQGVVDPSMIEEADLTSEDIGAWLRLKRQHWQAGAVREAVFPLPMQDVTQSHVSVDAPVVREMIDMVTGANNLIMGIANTGRRSATEVQGQMQLASGRMKMLIELVARQGVMPWAHQMIRNNQTFLDGMTLRLREPYAKLFGQPWIEVTPAMLQGEFHVPIAENGIPTDKLVEANLWKEMLQMGMQTGAAQNALPPTFWTMAMARFLWAMNVKDIQTAGLTMQNLSVAPDAQVQAQVQQGNLVPTGDLAQGESGISSDGFPMPPSAGAPNTGSNGYAGSA